MKTTIKPDVATNELYTLILTFQEDYKKLQGTTVQPNTYSTRLVPSYTFILKIIKLLLTECTRHSTQVLENEKHLSNSSTKFTQNVPSHTEFNCVCYYTKNIIFHQYVPTTDIGCISSNKCICSKQHLILLQLPPLPKDSATTI